MGFNGGSFPTPILDELAEDNAIKINFHYSDQVCSASRAALLTGRYSWRSGANSVVQMNTPASFDPDLFLFPELLNADGFNTYIAGKWHIGYINETNLPHYRGFDEGIFCHAGPQYYERGYEKTVRRLDKIWGAPNDKLQKRRNRCLGRTYTMQIHDTYTIGTDDDGLPIEVPVYFGNTSYNEDLYTEGVKSFISNQTADNPFFIYYSQWTPHSTTIEPPTFRPDGTEMDYSDCINNYDGPCKVQNETRCIFCQQVHYASTNIQDIIQSLKDNDLYDNSIVIITSDNGITYLFIYLFIPLYQKLFLTYLL